MLIADMLIIPLVLLIGYWWGNQGLFSAILHLLCVIVAGALAFAFWEPLAVGLLLRGGRFDGFAWGVSLIVVFVVALFVLRLATNKLVPANLDLPRWANLSFGFPVGLASGVLTMGITLIGLGFMQSDRSIAGFEGWRRASGGKVAEVNRLLLPVHKMTAQFYDALSVGAFSPYPYTPLRHYQPQLDRQAASLIRDSYREGRGQVAMRPDQVSIAGAYLCPDRVVLKLSFNRGARDYNDQLTLSAAQVRLVAAASGSAHPLVVHPDTWSQEVKDEGEKVFAFDDVTHYATSIPGRESADIRLGFPWRENLRPAFVQIKGARISIRTLEPLSSCDEVLQSDVATAATDQGTVGGGVIQAESEIRTSPDIRPVQTSTNALPGTISHEDRFLTEGFGFFPRSGATYSRQQQIKGIFEPAGTRIVQLDVGRTSSANIGGRVRAEAGDSASPVLVDSRGNTYTAMGYIYEKTDGTDIKLAPGSGLTLKDIPQPPSAGDQHLRLVFQVTEGTTLVGFRVGSVDVASCNHAVAKKG